MKKLMMAVAIVCAAALSQAAVVTWGSGKIASDSKGNAVKSADLITAYVWEITAADYATYSVMDAVTLSQTLGSLYEKGMPESFTTQGSKSNTYNAKNGALADVAGTIDHTAGTATANAYAAIIYVDNNNDGWYMGNVANYEIEGSVDVKVANLSAQLGGSEASRGATAWAQAVPEPTSGLLLLLGMAGLALRRRRA